MSKRKDKRIKHQHQENTHQDAINSSLSGESGNAKADTKDRAEGQQKRDSQSYKWMGLKERIKASSTTDWLLVFFNSVLAVVTICQFVIIGNQLDVMRRDERAWITVKIKSDTTIQPIPSGKITITNVGKTPALHLDSVFWIEVIPNGQEPHFGGAVGMPNETFTAGAVIPQDPVDFQLTRQKSNPSGGSLEDYALSDAEKKSLELGDAWLAIYGVARYQDVFGSSHWTQVCVWSSYLKAFHIYSARSCSDFNSVDER
jgi:hypothetical protein